MLAAVLHNTQKLSIEERPIPEPKEGEILVKTAYAGICRTDRKAYHMSQQDLKMPRVLGHEIVGTIAKIGSKVQGYALGEKVQIHPGIGCGICEDCREGRDQVCKDMEIMGFHIDGGFAAYCLIPAKGVTLGIVKKIPSTLPMEIAVMCEPLACAVNIFQRINPQPNQKLLIVGGGALGLLTATLAKIYGLDHIVITEKDPYKQKVCQDLGFPCHPQDVSEEVLREELQGKADIAIPCCPDNEGFGFSLQQLKKQGTFGFFSGLTAESPPNKNILNLIHYKELAVFGSYGCSINHGEEALKLLAEHQELFSFPTEILDLAQLEGTLKNLEVSDTVFKLIRF